jgi:hypothetical protein
MSIIKQLPKETNKAQAGFKKRKYVDAPSITVEVEPERFEERSVALVELTKDEFICAGFIGSLKVSQDIYDWTVDNIERSLENSDKVLGNSSPQMSVEISRDNFERRFLMKSEPSLGMVEYAATIEDLEKKLDVDVPDQNPGNTPPFGRPGR